MAATLAEVGDVQARIPYREITGESEPSLTDVQGWLDQAETRLVNTLASVGITVNTTSDTHEQILAPHIIDFAEGHTRKAYAAAGGDGQNDDGKDLLEEFKATLKDIRDNPGDWSAVLGGTPTPGTSGRLRGPSSSDTTDPMFTMADQEDQF